MRLLDGASRREVANISGQFQKVRLIELVAAPIQRPHNGVRQGPAIALQMLERDLGIVPTMVEINGGEITEPHPEIGRQREFRKVRPPKRRGDQKETSESGSADGLREVLQQD